METKFSVSLSKIISELELDVAYMPNEPETIHVSSKDITRPGLELTGFLDFFDNSRIILFGNTENKYLDLLLNKYQSECEINHISFEYSIRTANLSFMESSDLISIMSNILDNAVMASKLSEEKTVSLSINRNNSFDVLICKNSCDQKPTSSGDDLKTTKTESGIHGYGFKSIRRTAKKYNGDIEWKYDDSTKTFTITVIFPNK